ncbi:hypothetical protein [Burkholderia stabilis]|uniref:hypothetical protein n=1 Tax=Burkholderia stabilis TaxID=95485 RepID=UPI001147279F|nr:hypothetical protein [Burkholderia stabilis]
MYFLPAAARMRGSIQQFFCRFILTVLKNIEIAASVETLIYGLNSRDVIFAAQYFHSNILPTRIISIRLIIKLKPDFYTLSKIVSISVLYKT